MFSTIDEALLTVKKYSQIEDTTEHDILLTNLLDVSKAELNDVIEYRPFIVSANFLEFNRLNGGVVQATGTDTISFESSDKTIQGLFNMQKNLDAELKNIPKAWAFEKKLKAFSAFVV